MSMFNRSALTLLATTCLCAPAWVQAADPAKVRRITLEPGEQKSWSMPGAVVRAATGNPGVVGINVVPPKGVIITGMGPGTASVSVWEEGKNLPSMQYQVTVLPMSTDALKSEKQLKLESIGAGLRMTGDLSSLEKHQQLLQSATAPSSNTSGGGGGGGLGGALGGALGGGGGSSQREVRLVDGSQSGFDVQVQLDVKIVEVSRKKLESSGFYTHSWGDSLTGLSGPGNLAGFKTSGGERQVTSNTAFVPSTDAFNIFRWGANSLTVFSALERNGFAYVLAEPSLTALSGQTANFLAGGVIPIPVAVGSNGVTQVVIEWREFGIRLGMTPTVLDSNRIAVKVSPEISELDSSLGITSAGYTLPGLRVRRTETMVAAGDGETFVISGLVSQDSSATVDKFPFLGDIPILGAFFKSNRFARNDKELLMIVTPRLVRPFAKDAKLPALPGQEIKDYDPGYLRFLFLENGTFSQPDTGFSR